LSPLLGLHLYKSSLAKFSYTTSSR